MKIGVTQIILGNMSLDDTLSLCQDAGYDAVELTFGEGKDTDINMSDTELKGIAAKCESAGVEIASITAGYANRGNLLSPDVEVRNNGVKSLARGLEVAGALGVGGILLHPGQLSVEGTYQQVWDNLVDILKDLARPPQKSTKLLSDWKMYGTNSYSVQKRCAKLLTKSTVTGSVLILILQT